MPYSGRASHGACRLFRAVAPKGGGFAIATSTVGYGNAAVDFYDDISNHRLFGGPSQNIAFESTIDFNVTAASAGEWGFRLGVDFGWGGAVFLDGAARAFSSNDMWWGYSYNNPSQYFGFNAIFNAGDHQLKVYGLENCCDGGQQTQFRIPGEASYVTFGSPVPEPETYVMLLAGLGLIGFMSRRRKTASGNVISNSGWLRLISLLPAHPRLRRQ